MNKLRFDIKTAVKYLKAGYQLKSIINKETDFFCYRDKTIYIISEKKSIQLNEFSFMELYNDSTFEIVEEKHEETVDIKKDEEYYSWRQ